jgi:hypothetical protein
MPQPRKDVFLKFRASSKDIARWQAGADAEKMTLSDWSRRALNVRAEARESGTAAGRRRAGRRS